MRWQISPGSPSASEFPSSSLIAISMLGSGKPFTHRPALNLQTFGFTPRDVTIEELHIECCFPVDEATAQRCRELAGTTGE